MKIYDLSQEFFSSKVFPGDPAPQMEPALKITDGAPCNLTKITMGSHNGTHMDAPRHFYANGRTIDKLDLQKCVGNCKLVTMSGELSAENIEHTLNDGTKKLLIKGDIVITLEAAKKMTEMGLEFLGVEGLTVGPQEAPMAVHLELLGAEIVILEGAVMTDVPNGEYFLSSLPIKYGGIDGAQCRPILIKF